MRRRLSVTLLVLGFLLAGCGWPQPGFDAGQTSNNVYERTIGAGNVAALVPSWASSGPAGGVGTPIVQNGRVIGGYINGVRALTAASGAPLWVVPANGIPAPATRYQVAGTGSISGRDVVFIGAGNPASLMPPRTGTIGAYDSAVGSVIWSKEFGAPISNVVVVDGRGFVSVYRAVGDSSDFTGLVAFDSVNGSVLFRVPNVVGQLSVAQGTVFVGEGRQLDAVAAAGCGSPTCGPLWRAPVTEYNRTLTVAVDNRVYVGTNLGLAVFDASGCGATECAPLWTATGDFAGGMAVGAGRLYASPDWIYAQLNEIPSLRVFDAAGCGAATCNAIWQTVETQWFGPPTIANGVVYATEHIGPTRAWSAAGCDAPQCSALWSSGAVVQGTTTPIVADGRLFSGWDQMQTYVLPSTLKPA